MSVPRVTKVWRHAPHLSERHDIQKQLFGSPFPHQQKHVVMPTLPGSGFTYRFNEFPPEYVPIDDMRFDFEQGGINKRRERMVKVETWGDSQVEFWEWWTDTYYWYQVRVDA